MTVGFKKRIYGSWGEFFADMGFMIRNTWLLSKIYRKGMLPPLFRERLMVAVTSVYGCSICSWLHTREALRIGVDKEELARLVGGVMEGCPEEYSIAVLYAQHWAESNANPTPEAVQRLEETYGTEKAHFVNVVLRAVRLGNLAGNSWDYFLYRISFGRWRG